MAAQAQASLSPRDLDGNLLNGPEAYYDNVLNITWLANANLLRNQLVYSNDPTAVLNGIISAAGGQIAGHTLSTADFYDLSSGAANYYGAMAFATTLNVNGITGWRLPDTKPVNGSSFVISNGPPGDEASGAEDQSYNITSPQSELSYMYYVNLGLKGLVAADGTPNASYGVPSPTLTSVGGGATFFNVVNGVYWSRTVPTLGDPHGFKMLFDYGFQDYIQFSLPLATRTDFYAWAVHDGDVAAVPEPSSWLLMAGGTALLLLARRRRGAR
jgi:hypothetical protein